MIVASSLQNVEAMKQVTLLLIYLFLLYWPLLQQNKIYSWTSEHEDINKERVF